MSDHLTPVDILEALIGPPPVLEAIAGARPKGYYAWRRASCRRQAGWLPTIELMQRFLTYARARSIPLTADHLIWGAPRAEIEALLAQRAAA